MTSEIAEAAGAKLEGVRRKIGFCWASADFNGSVIVDIELFNKGCSIAPSQPHAKPENAIG